MKKIIVIAILLISSTAHAESKWASWDALNIDIATANSHEFKQYRHSDISVSRKSDSKWGSWDRENTLLHVPLTVLYAVDYKQTVWIHEHPDINGKGFGWHVYHKESNNFLGDYPSRGDIDKYFIGTYALTTLATWALPEKWSHALQGGVISIELYAVNNNYRLGIGIKF